MSKKSDAEEAAAKAAEKADAKAEAKADAAEVKAEEKLADAKAAVADAKEEAKQAASDAAEARKIPKGYVPVTAPKGVTSVSAGVLVDGRWYVASEVADTLVRMHGFTRG